MQGYSDISKELKNSIEENEKAIESSTKSIENRTKIAQDSINSQIAELEYIKKLTGELDTYVEANGKVKEGYKDRVNFILGELNEALGTEYVQVDGVIQKYQDLKDNVYKVIDAKKAEIILNANEKLYADAIQNITKHYQEKETAINNNTKAQENLNAVLKKYGLTMEDYTNNTYEYEKAIISYSNIWTQDLIKAVSTYRKSQQDIDNATKNWTDDCKVITDYENLKTATITGNQEEINKTLQELTSQYETETGRQTQSIQEQINQELELIEYKKQRLLETQGEINKETEIQLNAGLQSLANNLVKQTNTVEELTPDQIKAWQLLADKSEAVYNEKISQINPNTQLLLETIINTTGKLSPAQIQQWADMAKNSKEQYEKNLSGLDSITSQKIQSCVDAMNNEKLTAEQTANALADSIERGLDTIDAEAIGRQIPNGVGSGINENKNSKSLWKSISDLGDNIKNWFKNKLGIHSPSKVFADLASYIPSGIAKGITDNIDDTTKPIKELTNNITDTFSNNINVPNIAKELNQGIKINPKDFKIDTNRYVNYSAIKGKILAQSQISMNENIADRIAEAVTQSLRNAELSVNIEAKTEEGVIINKVVKANKEYIMQTGESLFAY